MTIQVKKLPWYLSWKGLLGTKIPKPILIKTRFGIHTFGMRYPIDVIVLDEKNRIRKVNEKLKPNSIFLWSPIFSKVVELPAGSIRKNKLSLKRVITLQTF